MRGIALCVISNKPDMLVRMASTLQHAITTEARYALCISYQMPEVKERDIERVREYTKSLGVRVLSAPRKRNRQRLFDFANARLHSFELAKDADFIVMMDDDYEFKAGTKGALYSSGDRYLDAVKYLEKNTACGVVCTKHFLGGSNYGRWILPMGSGHFNTGTGMVFRGKTRHHEIIHPDLMVLGAGSDGSICYTALWHGYYVAKALNNPTWIGATKRLEHGHEQPEYDLDHLWKDGTYARTAKLFGSFKQGILTQDMIEHYRKATTKRGYTIMF